MPLSRKITILLLEFLGRERQPEVHERERLVNFSTCAGSTAWRRDARPAILDRQLHAPEAPAIDATAPRLVDDCKKITICVL